VILFGINRGFDFSDEGLYVLLADPDQQNLGGIFNYDLFFKLFHQITGIQFGVVGLRIIRLLSYFLAAFALAVFWKNVNKHPRISCPIFWLSVAGLFAGYGFLPPTLSYNSISVVAICLWLAIVSKTKLELKDWLVLGIVFCTLFYVKITVGLVLGILTLCYFLLIKAVQLSKLFVLLSPFLLFEGLFYMLFQENGMTRLLSEYGFLYQRQDYSIISLIKYTAVGGFWVLLAGVPFWGASQAKKRGFTYFGWILALGILVLGTVFYFTFITSEWTHAVLLLTVAGISWQLGSKDTSSLSSRESLFIATLILLPFVLHFGSNVYWMRLGIHYWVFWLLALVMLTRKESVPVQYGLYAMAALSSTVLVIFGIWLTPFEGVYLWQAGEKWEYQPGKQILLSQQYIDFLSEVKGETEDGEKVIALYSNPGLHYMLGRTYPFSPGFWKSSQAKLFLNVAAEFDVILYNQLDEFPFEERDWITQKELTQPNGEKLLILWRK
jgi:hypothetical protein